MFSPGDRVKLEPGSDIYYISTLVYREADKYVLCDSDGAVKHSEFDSSRLALVESSAYEISESEEVSEADKSSEEDNTKQGQKRRKYVGSSESEKYGKSNL